jgi:hypothetical protein
MILTVTKNHLKKAKAARAVWDAVSQTCPIAQAAKTVLKKRFDACADNFIRTTDHKYYVAPKIQELINLYDAEKYETLESMLPVKIRCKRRETYER